MKDKIDHIRYRIKEAAIASGRDPDSVRLVAAGKSVPIDQLRLAIESGIDNFGENYIQEAIKKIQALANIPVRWHFIGHLQSKKAKYAVRYFDLIHTVDSLKLARALDLEAKKIGKVQDILIQVNVSKEATKSGIFAEECAVLVKKISSFENLFVKGLMTMPPYFNDPEKSRPFFKALAHLKQTIDIQAIPRVVMEELSMGMTDDFEIAILEGATLVRIGTAIFGKRP
jgi:PLP dependent protein